MSKEYNKPLTRAKIIVVMATALIASQALSVPFAVLDHPTRLPEETFLLLFRAALVTAAVGFVCTGVILANEKREELLCWLLLAYIGGAASITSLFDLYSLAMMNAKAVEMLFFCPGPQVLAIVFVVVPKLRIPRPAIYGLALLAGLQLVYWLLLDFTRAICSIT